MIDDRAEINALKLRCILLEQSLDMQQRLASEHLSALNTETARRVELEAEVVRLERALARGRREARAAA